MNRKKGYIWFLFFMLILPVNTMLAQNTNATSESLDGKQQSIVRISALTAVGDLEPLKIEFNQALAVGLTVNEIKEVLVHLYAYCGFPRSLNAINTFMTALNERQALGFNDTTGPEIGNVSKTEDKYEQGRKVLELLTKTPQSKPAPGFGAFAPRIDVFLKEHLFADIFESDVLTYQQRELVTISALAAMTGVEPQLQAHVTMGMNTGLTEAQLIQVVSLIEKHIGKRQADSMKGGLGKVSPKK